MVLLLVHRIDNINLFNNEYQPICSAKNNTQHSHNRNVERFILFPLKDIILCKYIDISVDKNNFSSFFMNIDVYCQRKGKKKLKNIIRKNSSFLGNIKIHVWFWTLSKAYKYFFAEKEIVHIKIVTKTDFKFCLNVWSMEMIYHILYSTVWTLK